MPGNSEKFIVFENEPEMEYFCAAAETFHRVKKRSSCENESETVEKTVSDSGLGGFSPGWQYLPALTADFCGLWRP